MMRRQQNNRPDLIAARNDTSIPHTTRDKRHNHGTVACHVSMSCFCCSVPLSVSIKCCSRCYSRHSLPKEPANHSVVGPCMQEHQRKVHNGNFDFCWDVSRLDNGMLLAQDKRFRFRDTQGEWISPEIHGRTTQREPRSRS